mgnify:CR=1 FL=1
MRKSGGFTLIELVLTLTIIGVLTAIIAPNFNSLRIRAKETNVKSTASAIQIALESYYLNNNRYPTGTNIESLITELNTDGVWSGNAINPFTQNAYTNSDTSGKITYSVNNDIYQLRAYAHDGTTVLIAYP